MALAGEPEALLLDEPTTGLDVTTQAHILELLRDLARDTGMAMVYVSHDLGAIARVCDHVVVMYAGEIVLEGSARRYCAIRIIPMRAGCWPPFQNSQTSACRGRLTGARQRRGRREAAAPLPHAAPSLRTDARRRVQICGRPLAGRARAVTFPNRSALSP